MQLYRFYLLDHSNHFRGAELIEALDDAEASAKAVRLQAELGVAGFELWDRGRPVVQQLAQP